MSFGTRLAEERKRLDLKQAEFAKLVGTDVPRQSLYENDKRELRADYLARLAAAERRCGLHPDRAGAAEREWLGQGASDLLTAYLALPADMQEALEALARALAREILALSRRGTAPPQSISTQVGAWSLAFSRPRYSLSTPASSSRSAACGESRRWSIRKPASRCQQPAV